MDTLLLLVLVNAVVDAVLGVVLGLFLTAKYSGKAAKSAIIGALKDPDQEVQEAIAALAVAMIPHILSTRIETGRKLKDEDGNEIKESLPFLSYAGRELSNHLLLKLKAARGGATSQAGAKLDEAIGADPSLASLMGGLGPRKGQSTQEYLFEQLMQRLMPTIEKKISEKLNTGAGQYNP